jgi:hypothetical protein
VSIKEEVHKIIRHREKQHPRDIYLSADEYAEVDKDHIQDAVYETYMTEIQLRRIVDRNAQEGSEQQSDGDERMVKDGENISKFSKEAMTLGDDVYAYEGNVPTWARYYPRNTVIPPVIPKKTRLCQQHAKLFWLVEI